MPRVDELLAHDANCATNSLVILRDLRPSTVTAFEDADALFEAFAARFNTCGYEDQLQTEIETIARATQLPYNAALLKRLRDPNDHEVDAMRPALAAQDTWYAQKIVFRMAWRYFRWATTDIRRLRISAAAGYWRLECEALGFIRMFQDRPDIARRWMSPTDDPKKLFNTTQPLLKPLLETWDLKKAYDFGSNLAMHVSLWGAVRSIQFHAEVDHLAVEVADQEFDPRRPYPFHLAVAYFLRVQQRFFSGLPTVLAPLHEAGLQRQVAGFLETVEGVWFTLGRRYERELAESAARMEQEQE
jgi:hypothetical protein